MKRLSNLALFIILCLSTFSVSAKLPSPFPPDKIITGKITDQAGMPVAGVSVVLKGTTTGTMTDDQGNFQLSVPETDGILVISYSGYATQEIKIGTQTNFSLQIAPTTANLDEVVVIGY